MLRAEWQLVNRPDRIQALADKHSDLAARLDQPVVSWSDIPNAAGPSDGIGAEARSARPAEPTNTPSGKATATPAPPPAANREPTMNAPVRPHDLARHNANEPYEPAPGDAAYVDPARYAEGIPADGFAPQEPRAPAAAKGRRIWGLVSDLFNMRLDKSGHRVFLVATGFTCLYLVIGGRLVQLGLHHDAPTIYRRAAAEISGARPDILDRNGEMLATDVKTVSVFAEPRRIVDKDEAVELLTAVLPDLDARELREKLGQKRGFVWIKREITPRAAAGSLSPRPARHRLHAREQARLSERAVAVARHRLRRTSTTRASPGSRSTSTARGWRRSTWPASPPTRPI